MICARWLNVYGEDDPLKPITIDGESGTPNFDRLAASGVTFLNAPLPASNLYRIASIVPDWLASGYNA